MANMPWEGVFIVTGGKQSLPWVRVFIVMGEFALGGMMQNFHAVAANLCF